jgi:WD40 repeat protein
MVNPTCVAFSPNGKRVAAADAATDLLRLFDVSTGKPTEEFHGFDQRVGACAFSPDGQRLAATDDSGVMVLLGVGVPGEIVPELELTYPERTAYSTLVFKPDGEALFGGSLKSWSQYWFGDYAAPDEPYP